MLIVFLQFIYVAACFLLVVVVLLQSGKGGGISSAFGIGGASQTLFGASGAGNVLTRATSILGAVFMVFSLILALLAGAQGPRTSKRSLLQPAGAGAPVTPGAGEAQPGAGTENAPGGTTVPTTPPTTPPAGTTGGTGR